ncbi:hypothetical protein AB0M36_33880 [Actinoplanes sp. NPDC051346]
MAATVTAYAADGTKMGSTPVTTVLTFGPGGPIGERPETRVVP